MTGEILEAYRVWRLSDSPSIHKTDLWTNRADCTSAMALRCLHFHCHTSGHQPGRAGALWEPEGEAAASSKAQAASWRSVENGSGDNRPRCDGAKELPHKSVCTDVCRDGKRERARLIKPTWGGAGLTLATAEGVESSREILG